MKYKQSWKALNLQKYYDTRWMCLVEQSEADYQRNATLLNNLEKKGC
jgi:hypothetical protein